MSGGLTSEKWSQRRLKSGESSGPSILAQRKVKFLAILIMKKRKVKLNTYKRKNEKAGEGSRKGDFIEVRNV